MSPSVAVRRSASGYFNLLASLLLLALLALAPHRVDAADFSLEQVRGYAFPQDLVAARASDHVAWIVNDHGQRNIKIASAPAFQPRQITRYVQDDGQEISSLRISDDGQRIVYVRGGEHGGNWDGELPINPASSPVATKVELWSVASRGGNPVHLAEGDYPALSPDGRQVVFLKDSAAWVVPSDGSKEPRRLFTTRGEVQSPAWSPDGKRIAFVASRDSHAFIGVYRDDAMPLLWLAPSTSRDSAPRWSPDGKRIAFVREPGEGGPPKPRLKFQASPWAIWVADASTGEGVERWKSSDALRDSNYYEAPEWADGGNLIFRSYRDGWQHLYSLPANSNQPILLTPGDYMVENFALSHDLRQILFDANTGGDADDEDRRHLFRVAVAGGAPQALTVGAGLEWTPVSTGGKGHTVFFSATAQRPPLPALLAEDGSTRLLENLPADFPLASMVVPKRVSFKAEDGVIVHGQLFEPVGAKSQRPAVVYVHGGPQRQMLLGWHYMGYYSNDYAMNQYLASRGYVVLSINYRLGPGYGHDYHFPADAGPRGASEYRDVRAGGRFLQTLPGVDGERIGIYGGSYGGYLTAMALAHDSALFEVGVDVHGVHDWVADEYRGFFVRKRYEVPPDAELSMDVGWKSSPVSAVSSWKSPVLFIHGDDDRNVRVSQTVDLVQRLNGIGVHQESLILVDETHSIQRYANVLRMNAAVAEFLQRHLGE